MQDLTPMAQWHSRSESLEGGRVRRVKILRDGALLTYAGAIEAWRQDGIFRDYFIGLLAAAPFDAYFWETPPLTRKSAENSFEFVLAESPALAKLDADTTAFAEKFAAVGSEADVAVFSNLGGDALLLAPCPKAPLEVYPHLAAFARRAPKEQQHRFWQAVGRGVADSLADQPQWLSTSGLGVAWLHVRFDRRPKYYTYRPYRKMV